MKHLLCVLPAPNTDQVFNKHLLTWTTATLGEVPGVFQCVLYGRQMKGRELSNDLWPVTMFLPFACDTWPLSTSRGAGTELKAKRLWEGSWGLTWGTSASASSGSAWWAVQTLGTGLSPRTELWLVSYWAQGKITLGLVQPWCQEARERPSVARPWLLLLATFFAPKAHPLAAPQGGDTLCPKLHLRGWGGLWNCLRCGGYWAVAVSRAEGD